MHFYILVINLGIKVNNIMLFTIACKILGCKSSKVYTGLEC